MPETVNGPDGVSEWDLIDWASHERNVARLRRRIFTASRDGDLAKVRDLQKLALRSWSVVLMGVRQVTQRNAGRRTAGVDRVVALDGPARMEMAREVSRTARSWRPLPVRRVRIPKAGGKKLRPLGIPKEPANCPVAQGS
jgi:RNA-directed DNA polymerase